MDSEGQMEKSPEGRREESPLEDQSRREKSPPPPRPQSYPGTRRVSFSAASIPGTLEEETETEGDDDGVTVQDLREEVRQQVGLDCDFFFGGGVQIRSSQFWQMIFDASIVMLLI